MTIQTLIIPAVGPTLNQWYAGGHWSKRSRTKKAWRTLVSGCVRDQSIRPVEHYPAEIRVTGRFGKGDRSYDCTNMAATAKLIEDGLVHAHILRRDSREYVQPVVLASIRHKGETDTLVEIIEVPREAQNERKPKTR